MVAFRRRRVARLVLLYAVLIALAAVFLIPYYIIIRNAFSTRAEITAGGWSWFPAEPTLKNIAALVEGDSPILRGLWNSFVVATVQLVAQLAIAALAGYGLARIPYKHRNLIFVLFLATMMVPSAVTFVPTFAVIAQFGWVNTLTGIIVPGLFNVFMVFIFRQFFLDFPQELEEAGRLDGLGYWGTFVRIVLPNSGGVMVALGAIGFINSWNAFLWPLVVGQDESTWTVQVAMSTYLNSYKINLPGLFAASLLSVLPLILLFFVFQRYIVQGVKFSGSKG
ncbi:carbohydrate ABC transporter permease [Mycetocola tolaasinivorans]|uniref:Carbohydrate ABC transporter permease n=1 Tax=Mycetocola tolaasinivorans TaxID=76635 RepID=A0A3L7A6R6_9MICO|nr:carbohydrate ABC transporter permease [Mycetocola tolaasinivorans]RLP76026.1 carbohydrate ABC transporter permease [Mycetocola tolaasinivorans]